VSPFFSHPFIFAPGSHCIVHSQYGVDENGRSYYGIEWQILKTKRNKRNINERKRDPEEIPKKIKEEEKRRAGVLRRRRKREKEKHVMLDSTRIKIERKREREK